MAKTIIDTAYPIDTESDSKLVDTKVLYDGKKVLKYSVDKDYLSIRQNFDLQNEREIQHLFILNVEIYNLFYFLKFYNFII